MSRPSTVVALMAVALVVLVACEREDREGSPATEATTTRPNVVLFLTDDQTLAQMRFLEATAERLGESGVRFDNAVVSYPTCCPSRATILTGQYARNHGVLWNAPPTGGFQAFEDSDTAMPAALADAGYETIHIGRFLNGYGFFERDRVVPDGWTDWHALVAPSDGRYFDYTILENGRLRTYGDEDYLTDVLADKAIAAIDRARSRDAPFFLHLAFTAPHGQYGSPLADRRPGDVKEEMAQLAIEPPLPAPRHDGQLATLSLPRPPSFDRFGTNRPDILRPLRPISISETTRIYQAEAESLLSVDDAVVAVLDHLEETGLDRNSYVIFTSDNGFFHGEHGIAWGKYVPYEEAVRVPLLMRGPGIPAGEERSVLVANVDLAPTIHDWTGVAPRRALDGISLAPFLADTSTTSRRAVLIEGHAPEGPRRTGYEGVRTDRWSYVEWASGDVELYDLEADPHQLENLAGRPRVADRQQQLADALERLSDCSGVGCSNVHIRD